MSPDGSPSPSPPEPRGAWRGFLLQHPATAWAALALSLLVTAIAWGLSTRQVNRADEERFVTRTDEVAQSIQQRMLAYQAMLEATEGYFVASETVTRAEFQAFVESMEIETYFPGVQGIGFAQRLEPGDLAAHEVQVRSEGFPQYAVRPAGERPLYTSIVYLEPFTGRNLRAFGYDMYSEPVRRAAMEAARDTEHPTLSAPVTLVQETDRTPQPGVLLYEAVYRRDLPHVTLEERRANVVGWVYSPFRVHDLVLGIVGKLPTDFDFEIYDGSPGAEHLLFDSGPAAKHREEGPPRFERDRDLAIAGARTWTLRFHTRAGASGSEGARVPTTIAVLGLLVDVLLFAMLRTLARRHQDLSELTRKITLEAMTREENFRQFFDHTELLLVVMDMQGLILRTNHAVTARLDYAPEELEGRSALELRPVNRRDEAAAHLGEIMRGTRETCPIPLQAKSGQLINVETRVTRGEWEGRPALFCSSRDMTALALSEEKFGRAFHGNPCAMAISTVRDGVYVDVNEAFLASLGYRREEVLGQTTRQLKVFANDEQRDTALAALKRDGHLRNFEVDVRHRDGSVRNGLFSADLFNLQGQELLLTVMVDITARRQAEDALVSARREAEGASVAKSAFLAMMSHEIRTPLNGVLGMAELMEATTLSDEQRQYLAAIRGAGDHLLAIINDILDFSRIEAGALRFECLPFDPAEVAREVVQLLHPRAEAKGVSLGLTLPAQPAPRLLGDPVRVRQVLTNLLGNGIKFTSAGSVTVALGWKETGAGRGALTMEVRDSGIGITPEERDRLFQVFVQADVTTARKFGGTGLGLAISKRLVEGMGGRIGVHSVPGEGSTFWFELPLAEASRTAPRPSPAVPVSHPEHFTGTVLLAEDNPLNRRVAQKMLQNLGLTVLLAEDGQQALHRLAETPVALIFMDMQMPGLDGLEATRRIRAGERGNRVPIVALTANALPEDRRLCLAAGMDDFLSKPIHQAVLAATLHRWLGPSGPSLAAHELDALPTIERERLDAVAHLLEVEPAQALVMVLQSAEPALAGIANALAVGDGARVARLARALHAACSEAGATRLAAVALAMEVAMAGGHVSEALALHARAQRELEELHDLRRHLPSAPQGSSPGAR